MASQIEELPDAAPNRGAGIDDTEMGRDAMPSSSAPNLDNIALTQSSTMDDGPGGAGAASGGNEKLVGVNLIVALKQNWINENAAPELLYYEMDTVSEVKSAVSARQEVLDNLARGKEDMKFLCSLLQMELDRINFLLHSYHRCR